VKEERGGRPHHKRIFVKKEKKKKVREQERKGTFGFESPALIVDKNLLLSSLHFFLLILFSCW